MTSKNDREIAEAATPGPWYESRVYGEIKDSSNCWDICAMNERKDERRNEFDSKFIAHFNPARVIEMLDRIEELEEMVKKLNPYAVLHALRSGDFKEVPIKNPDEEETFDDWPTHCGVCGTEIDPLDTWTDGKRDDLCKACFEKSSGEQK